jgi:hypothetical protein
VSFFAIEHQNSLRYQCRFMPQTVRQPKANPTLTAVLRTLKRLQDKHNGVVEAAD